MTIQKKRKGSAHKRPTKNPTSNNAAAGRRRKRHKKKRPSSNPYRVAPPDIRPLVNHRSTLLPSEDQKLYDALFGHIAGYFKPADALRWLDVKKLQDLCWEQMRLSRIKPAILQGAQKDALASLFNSIPGGEKTDLTEGGLVRRSEIQAIQWYCNPNKKEELEQLLGAFNWSEDTIDAMAFLERMDELMAIDKMQFSNEMQQTAVRNRLEEARHILQLQPEVAGTIAPAQPQIEHQEEEQDSGEAEDAEPWTETQASADMESDGADPLIHEAVSAVSNSESEPDADGEGNVEVDDDGAAETDEEGEAEAEDEERA